MKKIIFLLLLIPLFAHSQVQTDAQIITQINTQIRGSNFNSKNHANAFKTIVDSKANRSMLSGWLTGTLTGNVDIDGAYFISLGGTTPLTGFGASISGSNAFYGSSVSYVNGFGNITTSINSGGSIVLAGISSTYNSTNGSFSSRATSANTGYASMSFTASLTRQLTFSESSTILDIGSDANEDTYVRRGGLLTRIAVGSNGQVLTVTAGTVGWATPSGGGITNTAAANELMKSNGTNAVPSGFFSTSLGDFNLGTGLAGSARTIQADGSASNVGLNLLSKGTGQTILGGGTIINLNHAPGGVVQVGSAGSAGTIAGYYPGTFTVRGAAEADNGTANNITVQGGDWSTGNNPGTNVLIKPGSKSGSGATGAIYQNGKIGLFTTTLSNWQGMENGLYIGNRTAAPSTGLLDGVALFAEDFNSSSELYSVSESGAKYNLTGLIPPIVLTGTSLTLDESYRGAFIYCTNSSAITITVPAGFPLGWNCTIWQDGTGAITVVGSGGTTINGKTSTGGVNDKIGLNHYKATNVYAGI